MDVIPMAWLMPACIANYFIELLHAANSAWEEQS